MEGDESADASSDPDAVLRFNLDRPRIRILPGSASPTRFESRVDKLELDRVLPCTTLLSIGRPNFKRLHTVELLVALPRRSYTYAGSVLRQGDWIQ